MKVSLEWLREWLGKRVDPVKLSQQLTDLGLEVEGTDGQQIEIKVTSNRGDALSVLGVARELLSSKGQELSSMPLPDVNPLAPPIKLKRESPSDCPRYSLCLVDNVSAMPSPKKVQERIKASGLKPHNAVVDATNYVLLLMGQPLHAFDYDLLGSTIVVRRARSNERFLSLDGKEYKLSKADLVIANHKEVVALAGVIGGISTGYREETKRVLIESAHFSPALVRFTARRHAIRTESSYRFERFVDPEKTLNAALLCASFIQEWTGATILGWQDSCEKIGKRKILVSFDKIEKILGSALKYEKVCRLLAGLGIEIEEKCEQQIQLTIPTFRPDLKSEEDIAEEIARVQGYGSFPSALPSLCIKPGRRVNSLELTYRLRQKLLQAGLQEVFTPSLSSAAILESFNPEHKVGLPLRNPLTQETAFYRPSLLPGILRSALLNIKQNKRTVAFFEIGKVANRQKREERRVALAFAGTFLLQGLSRELKGCSFTLADLKAFIASLFPDQKKLLLKSSPYPLFREGKSLCLQYSSWQGWLGEAKQGKGIFLAELPLDALSHLLNEQIRVHPVSNFPIVERNLAFVSLTTLKVADLEKIIQDKGKPLLKELELFDLFTGPPLKKDEKSLAFRLVYQAPDRTLRDEEIDRIEQAIVHEAAKKKAYLRPKT